MYLNAYTKAHLNISIAIVSAKITGQGINAVCLLLLQL